MALRPVGYASVAVFALWAPFVLSGFLPAIASQPQALVTCQALLVRRSELTERRDAARAEMERDVDLALHSVPGQTLDAVGEREAAAYIERIHERWRASDVQSIRALTDIDEALQVNACRRP